MEIKNIEGQIGVTALYEMPYQAQDNVSEDGVKISRKYEVNGKATNEFKANDLVKVTISYQFGAKALMGIMRFEIFYQPG